MKVEPVAVEACEGQKQVVQQGFGALVWDLMLNEMKENLVAMIQARMVMCAKTFRYAQSENNISKDKSRLTQSPRGFHCSKLLVNRQ